MPLDESIFGSTSAQFNVPWPISCTLAVFAIVVVLVVTLPYPPFLLTVTLIFMILQTSIIMLL